MLCSLVVGVPTVSLDGELTLEVADEVDIARRDGIAVELAAREGFVEKGMIGLDDEEAEADADDMGGGIGAPNFGPGRGATYPEPGRRGGPV